MTVERSGECKVCGKHIAVNGTPFNQMFVDELFRTKARWHWISKHGKWKDGMLEQLMWFVINLIIIPFKAIAQIVIWIIWLLTYPVWALHEFLD